MKRHMSDNRLPNCGSMCGSPSLAGLGQHWPPAVAQQYPRVPLVLHSGGQSPPTECTVLCACVWVGGRVGRGEGRGKVRGGKGGEKDKRKGDG